MLRRLPTPINWLILTIPVVIIAVTCGLEAE